MRQNDDTIVIRLVGRTSRINQWHNRGIIKEYRVKKMRMSKAIEADYEVIEEKLEIRLLNQNLKK